MADLEDVRRIALSLPETAGSEGFGGAQAGFAVLRGGSRKPGGFAWTWMQRVEPNKPRVPCPEVLAVRTATLDEKDGLIAADPDKYFTEPHYSGFPAVLVRLANVGVDELEELLIDGWRCMAPRALVKAYDASPRTPPATAHRRS